MRILIIDSSNQAPELLQKFLTKEGHDAVLARKLNVALSRLDISVTQDNLFDLICLDNRVDGRTGLDVLTKIRNIPKYRHVPVIGAFIEVDVWKRTRDENLISSRKERTGNTPEYLWNGSAIHKRATRQTAAANPLAHAC